MRGTSRRKEGLSEIQAVGIEPALADPDRPGTLLELVGDVTIVHWLLGSAEGDAERLAAIHGSRLERILERLVDTPVRGFVYERAGSVPTSLLAGGAGAVAEAGRTWRIPVATVDIDPGDPENWLRSMLAATLSLASPAAKSK